MLSGAYINGHIPFDPIRQAVAALRTIPTRDGYPVQDYDRALHILEHGAPLQATYTCSLQDVTARNLYDNHGGVASHGEDVLRKILPDSNNQFVLVFL